MLWRPRRESGPKMLQAPLCLIGWHQPVDRFEPIEFNFWHRFGRESPRGQRLSVSSKKRKVAGSPCR